MMNTPKASSLILHSSASFHDSEAVKESEGLQARKCMVWSPENVTNKGLKSLGWSDSVPK